MNIMLELVNPLFFPEARRNVLVPNPEWYAREWLGHVKRFDYVWAKTETGKQAFANLNKHVVNIGWTSVDMHDAAIPRTMQFLHVAGKSSAKGTAQTLQAYQAANVHVPLVVVGERSDVPQGIRHYRRISDEELKRLMNESLCHICASSYEGFGHYINEARSVGAFIITTNAAPMNELVTPAFGIGVSVGATSWQNLGQHNHADVESLTQAIRSIAAASDVIAVLGARAREAFLKEREAFMNNLDRVLA